jgi:hypothetical protein
MHGSSAALTSRAVLGPAVTIASRLGDGPYSDMPATWCRRCTKKWLPQKARPAPRAGIRDVRTSLALPGHPAATSSEPEVLRPSRFPVLPPQFHHPPPHHLAAQCRASTKRSVVSNSVAVALGWSPRDLRASRLSSTVLDTGNRACGSLRLCGIEPSGCDRSRLVR